MKSNAAQYVDPFAGMDAVDDDAPLDLASLIDGPAKPRPKVDKAATRAIAQKRGFTSREPTVSAPARQDPALPKLDRRRRTGRNQQLNLKVTPEAATRFYALVERHDLVLGDAFEQAVAALEAKLRA